MTFKRTRDSSPGRGFIAQQSNTGVILWASCRDTEELMQGSLKVKLPARPGQIVFSNASSVFDTGVAIV